ncbi:hypothetical protein [Enterobacter asburiae]|uniref:hypothetical protein n=1 Tax=Enterobacter asburiae TaxID=61645 RepID=UPI003168FB65|nr:hypothetical protein [Enterobacter asburiae]
MVAFFTPKHDFHLSVCLPSAPRKELLVNRLAIIAALPEPAYGPTHGLLSRRSTDRISTSPLANFAQLSMFRFDGVIKHHVDLQVNTLWIYFVDLIVSC